MGKITADQRKDRAAVVKCLLASGNRPEKANLYADSFVEYQIAQANIEANGAITADPRTGAPIKNPYLEVRDKAHARLEAMHKNGMKCADLW